MRNLMRSLVVLVAISIGAFVFAQPAAGDPSFGSDAAFPVAGIMPNTVLDAAGGAPMVGPVPPPPMTVLPSLIAPPNPPAFGEVDDISYGDEDPMLFPVSVEFSVGPGLVVGAEAGFACGNPFDDDVDGAVNDGCPAVGVAEAGAACADAIDNDIDGAVNDGCPAVAAPAGATGHPAAPPPPPPAFDVRIEAGIYPPPPFGDLFVNSDIYTTPPYPLIPQPCAFGGNLQLLDGEGTLVPPFGPRLGINMPEPGSNVDAYERRDDSTVTNIPGPPLIDRPVFFTIDPATAAGWPGGAIPAPGGGAAIPGPGDILAWNPAIGLPVIWATAGALSLGPANDIDALAVRITPATMGTLPPIGMGWDVTPTGETIVFSLAPGSPALSPTSGGVAAPALMPVCFPAGTATSGDLFIKPFPFGPLAAGYMDAEQMGLKTDRSIGGPGPADDNVDAIDMCNQFFGLDIDGDFVDSGCDYDDDGDGIGDLVDPDDDGDGFGDPQQTLHLGPTNTAAGFDNCPMNPNPGQENGDGNYVDTSPPYAVATDDKTWPMSDLFGDACDSDDDNDGIADGVESGGPPCASATAATSPLVRDTDGDRALDGAECTIGTDPASALSFPGLLACGAAGDADGDKITNRIETCYYGSSTASTDSDGDIGLDGAKDGCEAASVNGDRIVNSIDQGKLASGISGAVVYHVGVDINKDGVLNSLDQGLMASFIVPPGQCP